MREVKVRGWDGMKMYYFDVALYMAFNEEAQEDMCPFSAILSLTLYTGLNDKNGKEIYVGDIVEVSEHPFDPHIKMNGKGFVRYNEYMELCVGSWLLHRLLPYCQVIGNIYEHSHLLNPELTEEVS
ncbi:YopX family protein [Brevibacillus laterosporus]|uniref:YopX family protein n=1 Tax=Brevibacillus laterosporus TaxID=1465 RepID=UPI0018CD951B|nr:YopX family protein [Brevibacillus laterosporus]